VKCWSGYEELSVIEEIRPEHFVQGKNSLGMRSVGENLILEHLGEDGGSIRAT